MRYIILPLFGLLYGYWTVCSIHDLFNLKDESKWWIPEYARLFWGYAHISLLLVMLMALIVRYW